MPIVVDPDLSVVEKLRATLPPGGHSVDTTDALMAWLRNRSEEYVVVLGPNVPLDGALQVAETLRIDRPTTSTVLVREQVDTEILTRAMHAGMREVVVDGDTLALSSSIERAYQLYIALRGPTGATRHGKIVAVFSPKGGVGKTTVSVNLALALADKGARQVCLVDLDLAFGDVAITMQLFPSHSIEHAIGAENALDASIVDPLLTRHADSLMVLAAPSMPDARDRVTPALVSRMLRTLQQQFDFVVVDTAPNFDEQTLTALDEVDECIIVATLDVPTLKNVKVALETMDALSIALDRRHLLLNRADEAVGISSSKVETILGMQIAANIASSLDIAASTNAGKPIVIANPEHPASKIFRELAVTLVDEPDAPTSVAAGAKPVAAESETDKNARKFRRRKP
jgi:pilus assembly protein CpaE